MPSDVLRKLRKIWGVAARRLAAAALLPQVLRQLGAVQIVLGAGHHGGDQPGEARRVEMILREHIPDIIARQRALRERSEQPAVPERMLDLQRVQRRELVLDGVAARERRNRGATECLDDAHWCLLPDA